MIADAQKPEAAEDGDEDHTSANDDNTIINP